MKTIVIPVTVNNRQGIDDIIDSMRSLFLGTIKVQEAIVVETDNPGMIAVAEALAEKSGIEPIKVPGNNGNGVKRRGPGKKTLRPEDVQP